jgi:rhodanese-related sulfurtransferase
MKAEDLLKEMKSKKIPVLVDVRTSDEFRTGHVDGAMHAPAWKILLRLAKIPSDKKCNIVVTCEHGPRASLAALFLKMYGYRNVELLEGHMAGWRRKGLPLQ